MPGGTNRERVIAVIRVSSRHLDDDQIAVRAGISRRQTVNQVCRALEHAGMARRRPGPDDKIVNEWLGDHERGSTAAPAGVIPVTGAPADPGVVPAAGAVPPGDSVEQRAAERVMLDLLGTQLGCELNPATITIPSGERVEVDGANAGRAVLAECWAHQGPRTAHSATRYLPTPSSWPG